MPDVSRLRRQVPVTVEWRLGDESVNVRFDREAITPALLHEMTVAVDNGDLTASSLMLSKIILDWDVTDGEQPWPASAENLASLSVTSLMALTTRISEASVPSDAEGNASSDTSTTPVSGSTRQPPETGLPQNGPDPSQLPAPSASQFQT